LFCKASAGRGKFKVEALAFKVSEGLVVMLVGGEKPHVGAVALSYPEAETGKLAASLLSVPRHRNGEVAKPASRLLARKFKVPVAVVAGLHVDNATRKDVEKLVSNAGKALERLVEALEKGKFIFMEAANLHP